MNEVAKSVIVSYSCGDDKDNAVLIVGEKCPYMDVAIVNAFQGAEANELWQKLTVRKEEKK